MGGVGFSVVDPFGRGHVSDKIILVEEISVAMKYSSAGLTFRVCNYRRE
jgi:hypothetical protein